MQTVLHSFAEFSSANGIKRGFLFMAVVDSDSGDDIHDG